MIIAFFWLYTDSQLSRPILKVELKSRAFQIQHGQGSYRCPHEKLPQLPQRLKFAGPPFIKSIDFPSVSAGPLQSTTRTPLFTKTSTVKTFFNRNGLLLYSLTEDAQEYLAGVQTSGFNNLIPRVDNGVPFKNLLRGV